MLCEKSQSIYNLDNTKQPINNMFSKKLRRLGAKESLFFSLGRNTGTPFAVQIQRDTGTRCHAACGEPICTCLIQFLHPVFKQKKYQILLPDPSSLPEETQTQKTGDQLRLVEALQGIEGSLEPIMQAGTLFHQHRPQGLRHKAIMPHADMYIIQHFAKKPRIPLLK